ncbi:hypothetical protein NDU88_000824 [Pleurodeles waltl]|uniref:Uncharacterized protein n=1 Tax=Pleurodeles waltl TaxID=8319 RepID=A0AAV7VZM5_PLEWA|nr:hypothetical protein NDU88_000824 [Pleurodeles waltl]
MGHLEGFWAKARDHRELGGPERKPHRGPSKKCAEYDAQKYKRKKGERTCPPKDKEASTPPPTFPDMSQAGRFGGNGKGG